MGNNVKGKKEVQEKFSRVIANSLKFLDSYTEEHANDYNYIPESVQPYVNNFVRDSKSIFDNLSDQLYTLDKSSDEYIMVQKEMENIARTFINARGQVDMYKKGIGDFKNAIGGMNPGTQESSYFLNSAVFGYCNVIPYLFS